jgi:hypothetical protein
VGRWVGLDQAADSLLPMAVALRISGFVEELANAVCRGKIVIPLLVVLVASFFLLPTVFGLALTAVCMLAILWATNWILQRFVAR